MHVLQNDTVWTRPQSPIVISGHVNVSESATLTVEAGVHVVFTDESAAIEVLGMYII